MARSAHITPGIGVAAVCALHNAPRPCPPYPAESVAIPRPLTSYGALDVASSFWPRPIFIGGANDEADQHGGA